MHAPVTRFYLNPTFHCLGIRLQGIVHSRVLFAIAIHISTVADSRNTRDAGWLGMKH